MKPLILSGLLALCLSLYFLPVHAQDGPVPKSETDLRLKELELNLDRLGKDLGDIPPKIQSATDALRLELKEEIKKDNEGILNFLLYILLGIGGGVLAFFSLRNNLLKTARKNWEGRLEEERKAINKEWENHKESLEAEFKGQRKSAEDRLELAQKEIDQKISASWEGQLSKIRGLIKEQAPQVAREEVAEEVRKEVQQARKDLLALFEQQDYEKQVKEHRRLVTFSQSDSDARTIEERLKAFGFRKVKSLLWADRDQEFAKKEVAASDLVILDGLRIPTYFGMPPEQKKDADQFNRLQDDHIATYIERFPSELCYVLYRGGHSSRMSEFPTQVNFANTEFTLHPRIFETLVFRDLKMKLAEKG